MVELPQAAVGERKTNGMIDGINESIMKQFNFLNCGMVDEFDGINYGMAPLPELRMEQSLLCFSLCGLWPACRQCSAKKKKTQRERDCGMNNEGRRINE